MSFSDDWNKESENAIKALDETMDIVSIELFSGVITSTPVGNQSLWKNPNSAPDGYVGGSLRSAWILSFGSDSNEIKSGIVSESAKINEITKGILLDKTRRPRVLSNNLPYARRVENGWSSQAILGIVAPNVVRVEAMVPRIEAAVNKRYGV